MRLAKRPVFLIANQESGFLFYVVFLLFPFTTMYNASSSIKKERRRSRSFFFFAYFEYQKKKKRATRRLLFFFLALLSRKRNKVPLFLYHGRKVP